MTELEAFTAPLETGSERSEQNLDDSRRRQVLKLSGRVLYSEAILTLDPTRDDGDTVVRGEE